MKKPSAKTSVLIEHPCDQYGYAGLTLTLVFMFAGGPIVVVVPSASGQNPRVWRWEDCTDAVDNAVSYYTRAYLAAELDYES